MKTPSSAYKAPKVLDPTTEHMKTRWETWIDDYTPYKCGWWKGTFIDDHMVHAKMFTVAFIMVMIPTSLFVGIELSNGSDYTSVLRDAQKGSGG